jgi:transposase
MKIVGCDFHPSFQQIAILDTATGEIEERRLGHRNGEAEQYYRQLEALALIGMEAVGNSLWFEQLIAQVGHELWIGDAAQIRASYVRKQKTDRRDAGHILRLLMENRFPRIWTPSAEQRDVRQLLLHRHKLVGIRTRVKTELQHLALNRGLQKQRTLWSVRGRACLENLPLEGWTAQRREDLLAVLALVESQIEKLDEAVGRIAAGDRAARLLMTQPGVGPVTALAFVVTIGDVRRFKRGKQVGSYLGLIPAERSSGSKRRLGAISKQGNVFLRTLLVEAAQSACRYDEQFRKEYQHRCHQKPRGVAKVAAARKLAVRLYWMLRNQTPYASAVHNEGSSSHPVANEG